MSAVEYLIALCIAVGAAWVVLGLADAYTPGARDRAQYALACLAIGLLFALTPRRNSRPGGTTTAGRGWSA